MSRQRALLAFCAAACLAVGGEALASGRYDPRLRFRTVRTPHFTIYYHQGEAVLAARLATIAEEVRDDLARRTGLDAPAHAHVVLVDQSDLSNGWSTPAPYDLIEIAALAPPPSSFLGNHDDWLRLVFSHEYAHLIHLDRVGGVMKALRWALGRNPATFPNLFVPQWQVEGFATWAESAVTGAGRVRAADVGQVVAAASASGTAVIDRAGGGLVAWPSGNAPYFFGGHFDDAIARKRSERALGELARATARRIPFLGEGAYGKVLGAGSGRLWKEVFASSPASPTAPSQEIRRLTRQGFAVHAPRLVGRADAGGTSTDTILYTAQGPHRFPEVRAVSTDGNGDRHVVSRFAGTVVSSHGRWLFFDQLEYDGASAIVADLYAHDLMSGHTVRLSRGQRLMDPDIDPRGTRLAAVRAASGEKRLVVMGVWHDAGGSPALQLAEMRMLGTAGCQYASPRWSPDGTSIAAARQCRGSLPAIVTLGSDDGVERVVAGGSARNITPAWAADGRTVFFASDREDHRFKLFGVRPDDRAGGDSGPVLLLDAPGGVMWPDVSGDGRTVVFASLTTAGYDVFAAPLPVFGNALPEAPGEGRSGPSDAKPAHGPAAAPDAAGSQPDLQTGSPYSPWRTLLPRAWSPVFSVGNERIELGAKIGSSDALGYHDYAVSASWREAVPRADVEFDAAPFAWAVSYAYNRWRPSFVLTASSTLDTVAIATSDSRVLQTADERTLAQFAAVVIPWRRVRIAQSWLAGVDADERRLPEGTGIPDRRRNAFRAGWNLTSARQYGYSISPEDGVTVRLNVERVTPSLGADGNAFTTEVDGRAYVRGAAAHHVVAARIGAASSSGDANMRRTFALGSSGLSAGAFDMGYRSVGLVRGLPSDERAGTAVASGNLDYRFPIVRVERGIRTWPVFLRDIHGAAFADVASAGSRLGALPAPVVSLGAEAGARFTFGYSWDVNVAARVAWTHDPVRSDRPDRVAVFVRTGYAF